MEDNGQGVLIYVYSILYNGKQDVERANMFLCILSVTHIVIGND